MPNEFWDGVKDLDIDALAEHGSVEPNSTRAQAVSVAFQRLQTKAMQDAATAQIDTASAQKDAANAAVRAANAAVETAESTRKSANWMKWSVIVLAASSVINLLVTVFKH